MTTIKLARYQAGILIGFTSMLLTLSASGQQKWKEDKIMISGKVIHFKKQEEHRTIVFILINLTGITEKKICTIRDDGTYKFETTITFTQEIHLNYGGFTRLVLSPGDKLYLEIDADIWKNTQNNYPNGKYFVRITGGTVANENREVGRFIQKRDSGFNWEKIQKAIKEKTASEYKDYVYEIMRQDDSLLTDFKQHHKISGLFEKWSADYIKYSAWEMLMRYRWEHPMMNDIKRSDFKIPENYFSFLAGYNMNDSALISGPHAGFLHELYKHIKDEVPQDSLLKLNKFKKEKDFRGFINMQAGYIKNGTSGFTKDLFLTKYFYNILDGNTKVEFEQTYEDGLISNKYFTGIIDKKYSSVKIFLANREIKEGSNISSINSAVIKPIIDTIISRYKDKIIYIDFWAPWCVPCMAEMPHMKELQLRYKEKEVVFLFLANRCTDDTWKATIANKGLAGEHINLTDDQYNILAEKFKITGIPHYVLVDKRGSVVFENAASPSQKEKITGEIDKLLK